ncbi:hypothetical protein HU200_046489 [Digitaria exilis]|uniref:Uncharacterized protein n=1 Tax=Digitaria exilis TaxID=1010633 RepID=A0A835EC87_9POAL|nr:hypothetical protein HU200_046489 [Digitaria exilis]
MEETAGDEELESLLGNFRRVSQGYKDALMEVQALRVNYSSESKKREALELHVTDLKRDNERLRGLYTETLYRFTNQCLGIWDCVIKFYHITYALVKFHAEAQHLKEELEKANSRLLSMEEVANCLLTPKLPGKPKINLTSANVMQEHKREMEQLKHSSEMNSNALENELSHALVQQATDEAATKQLKLELAAHKVHIDMLRSKLEQVTADVHSQYKNEIQDLRDVIAVEQEEKNDMHRKLQSAENECKFKLNWGTWIWNPLLDSIPSVHCLRVDGFALSLASVRIMRVKQAEQQRDSISVQHVETLKQKVMKLRKENESLKRRLASSEV